MGVSLTTILERSTDRVRNENVQDAVVITFGEEMVDSLSQRLPLVKVRVSDGVMKRIDDAFVGSGYQHEGIAS